MKNDRLFIDKIEARARCNICLDPNSILYGSCDRNFWHYKIRDFSSIILQQGAEIEFRRVNRLDKKRAINFAKGALKFWSDRALRRNAFEEYYPFEDGYPPLAFSTLSVVRLISLSNIKIDDVPKLRQALERAAIKLVKRRELKALNQYSAGVAALAGLTKLNINGTSRHIFNLKLDELLSYQNVEGWFPEYGTFDIGYLSVTLDCLWDIYDIFPSKILMNSIEDASEFICSILSIGRISFGKFNSRNTDYVLPYGLIRTFCFNSNENIRSSLIEIKNQSFLYASLDDRYLMHYIGISHVRADSYFVKNKSKFLASSKKEIPQKDKFECAGVYRVRFKGEPAWLNLRKGVVCSKNFSDWGIRLKIDNCLYESGVVPFSGDVYFNKQPFNVNLTKYKEFIPSFIKLGIIKILACFFGAGLIGILKRSAINRSEHTAILSFDEEHGITYISNNCKKSKNILLSKSPPQSIRHVASAEWNL
ncbi:hypothetical protein OAW28_05055 [Alphaproteobacteria bacterium]|nr:hypothetical protein [Alphaproteobacteria bacterium]